MSRSRGSINKYLISLKLEGDELFRLLHTTFPLQNAPGTEAEKLTLKVILGRQCSGSVGRAVTSNTRGPRFESSHRKFLEEH